MWRESQQHSERLNFSFEEFDLFFSTAMMQNKNGWALNCDIKWHLKMTSYEHMKRELHEKRLT